jgi:hypothetical protein
MNEAKYYCHECSVKVGYLQNINSELNFTGSSYQLRKFIKHTIPSESQEYYTVFNSQEYDEYRDGVINTMASGSVEILNGKKNVVLAAGKTIGIAYNNAQIQYPVDAFKLVLYEDVNKMHLYPSGSAGFVTTNCEHCGKSIIH